MVRKRDKGLKRLHGVRESYNGLQGVGRGYTGL